MSGWAWIFTFSRSNTRENRHPRRLLGIGIFPPTLQPSCIHPSLLAPHLCSRQTIVRIVRCAATENLQSSLDCARGLLWRSTTTPRVRPLSPADNPDQRRRRSTTKSVTPTFQVDDLHCIVVDARARHGPHLDTGHPSPSNHPRPGGVQPPPPAAERRRGSRENKPDRGLSLLETEDCLAGYCELVGRGRVALEGCILIALSLCFSFLLFSFLSFFLRVSSSRGWDASCISSGSCGIMKLWNDESIEL